jgi:peptidoglycan/LPS O-acetylase OafA/YrhL
VNNRRFSTEPPASDRSVLSALNGHNNSLGIMRLVLALAVIASHAYPLGGFGVEPLIGVLGASDSLGAIAVAGFFAISGYLVLRSALSGDVFQFMWKRALRIFPGYWVALLVGVFAVGPLIWLLERRELGDYFRSGVGSVYSYLASNADLSIGPWGVWDIFASTTPYGEATGASVFNGSIWTLTYEWSSYLAVAVLLGLGLLRFTRLTVLFTTAFFAVFNLLHHFQPQIAAATVGIYVDGYFASLGFLFFVGASIGAYADKIRFTTWVGVASGVIVVVSLFAGGWKIFGYLAMPYFLLWVATILPQRLQWIGQKNDYSYGIYLYGFLVQQTTAYFGLHKLGIELWIALSMVISFGLAWLSWKLIERPAINLKSVGPGRGFRYWWSKLTKR